MPVFGTIRLGDAFWVTVILLEWNTLLGLTVIVGRATAVNVASREASSTSVTVNVLVVSREVPRTFAVPRMVRVCFARSVTATPDGVTSLDSVAALGATTIVGGGFTETTSRFVSFGAIVIPKILCDLMTPSVAGCP